MLVGLNCAGMRSPPWWATAHLRRRPFLAQFILAEPLGRSIKN